MLLVKPLLCEGRFSEYIAVNNAGTAGLTVPMFIALRRFTLVSTLVLEYCMYSKVQDYGTVAQIAVVVGGSLIAAVNDLTFNVTGYAAGDCHVM